MLPVQILEAQLYLFTHSCPCPVPHPTYLPKQDPGHSKPLHDRSSRGPCLQLVLFERNLAKFYHRRIPLKQLTAGKAVCELFYFPGKSALMGHGKQILGLSEPT